MEESKQSRQALLELSYLCTFPMAARAAILLGVPEILSAAKSALSADQIAERIRAREARGGRISEEKLDRLMRALATCGLFALSSDGCYALNGMSKLLVRDEEGLWLGGMFFLTTDASNLEPLRRLHHAVLDDAVVPFDEAFGQPLYQYVARNPEAAEVFQAAMTNLSGLCMKSILREYRGFEGVKVLVDVGGGRGLNSKMIVAANPGISALNFDMPFVVANAPPLPAGVEHRAGSMLEGVPTGGDAILLKAVLHNWDDESCRKILGNCFSALPDKGKVIIMEVLSLEKPDCSRASRLAAAFDVTMMAVFRGGKERSLQQFEKLLQSAGFKDFKLALPGDVLSVMEAYKLETS